ncbi:hypothetical protein D3C76_1631390 [compost metagenome]
MVCVSVHNRHILVVLVEAQVGHVGLDCLCPLFGGQMFSWAQGEHRVEDRFDGAVGVDRHPAHSLDLVKLGYHRQDIFFASALQAWQGV